MEHSKKLSVKVQLEIESLRRDAYGTFAQIALLVSMLLLMPHFRYIVAYHFIAALLILIVFVRWLIFINLKNKPQKLASTNPWNLYVGTFTSVIWAFLCGVVLAEFKIHSLEGLMHIYIATGLLAGVMYAFSPTPKHQRIYILILGISILTVILATEKQTGYRYAGSGAMLIFTIYLLWASRHHSHDLRSAFEFENSLMIQNMKLQEVIDSIPGFLLIISNEGELLQHSKYSRKFFEGEELRNELRKFRESNFERITKELDLKNASIHSYVVTIEKLKSAEGHIIVIGLPIDELKRIREQLAIQKANTEYASRLTAIGEMAGGVAHEINNPLSVISLSTEFLATKLNQHNVDQAIWKKHSDKIVETIGRISRIVKSLQNLTRADVLDEETKVDLDVVIKETLDISVESLKRKGINVAYKGIGSVFVWGRHLDLGQVLLNLINNSFDAIEGVGEIEITVEEKNNEIIVCVTDSGPGIPEHLTDKLFQPFFSTKPVGEGSGLGLPISRSLLMKFDGSIELAKSSHPTTFQITLKKA